jgi:hypothetical protein
MKAFTCFSRFCGFLILFFCLSVKAAVPELSGIEDFEIRENLIKNDKLAIIALDSTGSPQEKINGTFQFSLNGFKQEVQFHDGVGITTQAIESSSFVYVKHENYLGSTSKLYYVYKGSNGLKPIFISWYYLILIPLGIVLLGYVFKRLIVLAIILLVGLFIFNYSKGLNLAYIVDSIIQGIKNLVG